MPVLPTCGGLFHGAGFGAGIVNVERFEDETNALRGFFEVVEDEFSVFGEVEFSIEMTRFGGFSEIEFVDGRIEAAVDGEKIKDIGLLRFPRAARAKRIDVDIGDGV